MPKLPPSLPQVFSLLIIILLVISLGTVFYPKLVSPEQNYPADNNAKTPPVATQPPDIEVHAGDGKVTLIRKIELQPDQSQTYSFIVANLDGPDRNEHQIFSAPVESGRELTIPLNSWSPDNKYLFIQEKDQAGQLNYLVFKASGEPFANDEPYLDLGAFFAEKLPKNSLHEATGWASPIFINVKTDEGPAYWFDVQAKAFWGHR